MDTVQANILAYTIKYAKEELEDGSENPLINITLKRDDFKKIIEIAEKEVAKHG